MNHLDNNLQFQQQKFEQDQVIWAKIRGYPWWPSYIHQVIQPKKIGDQQKYLVIFFGDNTHSLLTNQKIKKYGDCYSQMYRQSKKNKKLASSIQMAEQNLKQNDERIDSYKQIREKIDKTFLQKKRRPGRPKKEFNRNEIQQSSQLCQKYQKIQQLNQKYQQSASDKQQIQIQKLTHIQSQKIIFKEYNENQITQKSQQQSLKQPVKRKPGRPKGCKKFNLPKNNTSFQQDQKLFFQEQNESVIERDKSQSQHSSFDYNNEKIRKIRKLRSRFSTDRRIVLEKKKQNDIRNANLSSFQSIEKYSIKQFQQQQIDEQIQISTIPVSQKLHNFYLTMSQHERKIIQRVQFYLLRRQQLIQFILNCQSLTPNVVEYILQRKVPEIILKGAPCLDGYKALQLLQILITKKYFPDDKVNEKKFIALDKNKKKTHSQTTDSRQNQDNKISQQKIDLQIRKKTVKKLQKLLRLKYGQSCKQHAIQIQSWFRDHDKSIGQKYKAIAYKTLRSLKDRPQQLQKLVQQVTSFNNNLN